MVQARRVVAVAVAVAVAVGLGGASAPARADRYEASLHVHALAGAAWWRDPAADQRARSTLAGLGVRVSYARANWVQYDAQLTAAASGAAGFGRGRFRFGGEPVSAPFSIAGQVVRLDAGATVRLGVRVIPTARLALGVEERFTGAPVVAVGGVRRDDADGRGPARTTALVGVAGLGVDYRLGPHLIAGAALGGSASADLDLITLELGVHAAWYWYPLWID